MNESFTVTGMSCDHCVRAVTEELNRLPGVTGVDVELATGHVTVTAARPLDPAAVRAAIEEAGYALADGPGDPAPTAA